MFTSSKGFVRKLFVSLILLSTILFAAPLAGITVSAQTADDAVVVTDVATDALATDVVVDPALPTEETVVVEEAPTPEVSAPVAPAEETNDVSTASTDEVNPATPVVASVPATPPELSISPEQSEYYPNQPVSIFGKFFSALTEIVLNIFGSNDDGSTYTAEPIPVTSDDTGAFAVNYTLDSVTHPLYTIVANALDGTQLAQLTFKDPPSSISYDKGVYRTDQGKWTTGNAGGAYVEGDWAFYTYTVNHVGTNALPSFNIIFDEYPGTGIFIDGLTNFRYCVDCAALPDGTSNPGLSTATWKTWTPSNINEEHIGSTCSGIDSESNGPAANHCFRVTSANFTAGTIPVSGDHTVRIFFEAHLAKTMAWGGGFESQLTNSLSPHYIAPPAEAVPATVYGSGVYSSWTGAYNGSGLVAGSSGHFNLQDQSAGPAGAITLPIPTVAQALSTFSGQKFNDINGNGVKDVGEPGLSGWTINLGGSLADSRVTDVNGNYSFVGIPNGSYTLCEVLQGGWTQTFPSSGASCSGPSFGYTITTTGTTILTGRDFGNSQGAHLTLVKTVMNDNGGTAGATAWTLSASGPTPISGTTGAATVTNAAVNAGTYTLSETGGPTGYTAGAWSCTAGTLVGSSLTLTAGQTATCTINNNDIAPTLTLVKTVTNDNGGNKVVSDFVLKIDGSSVTSGVANTVNAGAHSVSEINLPGYTASNWGGDCALDGSITLLSGDNKTCTITNDDQPGTLIVKKVVDNGNTGATTGADAFSFSVNGGGAVSFESDGQNDLTVNAGSYSVTEPGVAGYTTTYDNCTNVAVANGASATCTVTNTAVAPTLKVVKVLDNGNTGSTNETSDFQMKIDGGNVPQGVFQTEMIGLHLVSESGPDLPQGYVTTYSGDCDAQGNVSLLLGDAKTCTITNTAIAPKLTIVKTVVNDNGGTKEIADFILNIDTTPVTSGAANNETVGAHTASETSSVGYIPSMWGGDCALDGSITLSLADDKTCTITNDDVQPKLTVTKVVINHGGNAQISDFPLSVDQTEVSSDATNGFDAGNYVVSEVGNLAYTATITGDCDAGGYVTLTVGDADKFCTITNEEKPSKLIVTKVVINHGQDKEVSDFPLSVDTTGVTSGDTNVFDSGAHTVSEVGSNDYTATFSGDCDSETGVVTLVPGETKSCTITNEEKPATIVVHKIVKNHGLGNDATHFAPYMVGAAEVVLDAVTTIDSGTYTVTETNDANYTATYSGDCDANGSLTLLPGDNTTCTITNEEKPSKLIVTKVVLNDNGGTAVISAFPLFVDETGVTSGDENTFDSGSYTVSETNLPGYTGTISGDCDANGSVTLLPGETKSCTITNDDNAPKLTLVKEVTNDNGGTAVASDWTLTADGYNEENPQTGTYDLSESNGPSGYTQTSLTCSNAQGQVTSVTLGLGDDVTCTFVNDDQPAHLIVIKHVINDDGDVAMASDFTMTVSGNNPSQTSFAGSESGVNVTLNAGAYSANELANNGYVKTLSGDCAGTIMVGQTKTCTITNNDTPHATRTLGFWQTHTTYTTGVFGGINPITLGSKLIDNTSKLFAGFYASISKKSTGAKRSALDQARMQMLEQWLAAKLNCAAFTCSAGTQTLLTNAAGAWTSGTAAQILSYASQLDAYNNSNDALPISGQGKATPSTSQSTASTALSFWNVLP